MEPNEFQSEAIKRFQKLEREVFGGAKEENYGSPREQSKAISEGHSKEHHIGEKSIEVLEQELLSHNQSYQETFTNAEKKEWLKKKSELIDRIRKVVNK